MQKDDGSFTVMGRLAKDVAFLLGLPGNHCNCGDDIILYDNGYRDCIFNEDY